MNNTQNQNTNTPENKPSDLTTQHNDERKELNAYELKQTRRRERYERLAMVAHAKSVAVCEQGMKMQRTIPLGQPILIGHHSEKADRRFREKIHNTFGKSVALEDKAKHYENKAESVGTGGISSDDPDAIKKLRSELKSIRENHELMKAANKIIRTKKTEEDRMAGLIALGFSEEKAKEILAPNHFSGIGCAHYQLSYNRANARRIEQRIATLEKLQSRESTEVQGNGYTYKENTTENRIMFFFDGKPSEEVRKVLKSRAFKWSPSRGAWVRQITPAALYHGKEARRLVNEILSKTQS